MLAGLRLSLTSDTQWKQFNLIDQQLFLESINCGKKKNEGCPITPPAALQSEEESRWREKINASFWIINLHIFVSSEFSDQNMEKQAKHSLVPASQTWEYDACFCLLFCLKCLWIWTDGQIK